jgi:hypothetical protein
MDALVIHPDRCFECGSPAEEQHHVIPQSRGGTRTVPLCPTCHDKTHDLRRNRTDGVATLVREGQERARDENRRIGRPPYGYEVTRDSRLIENPLEQAVRRIVRMLRDDECWSFGKIASALNRWGSRSRTGRPWYDNHIGHIYAEARKNYEVPVVATEPLQPEPSKFLPGQMCLPIVDGP